MKFASKPPKYQNPILMFINVNSGGGLGPKLIKKCKKVRNIHVVSLPDEIDTFLEDKFTIITHPKLRVIACGGDGTVSWIMSILKEIYGSNSGYRPPLGVIPLGTGNDMSQSLKWGEGLNLIKLNYIFDKITAIAVSPVIAEIDTWTLTVTDKVTNNVNEFHFCNYFSFGVDAGVAYDYACLRNENKPLTRLGSFALYVPAGAHFLNDHTTINKLAHVTLLGEIKKDDMNISPDASVEEIYDTNSPETLQISEQNQSEQNITSSNSSQDQNQNENGQNESSEQSAATTQSSISNNNDTNGNNSNSNQNSTSQSSESTNSSEGGYAQANSQNENQALENDTQENLIVYLNQRNLNAGENEETMQESTFYANDDEQTMTFCSSLRMYAGRKLWKSKTMPHSMTDGVFEILLNKGATHLAMTNLGIIKPRSYGQAKGARIETNQKCYFQLDGEAKMIENPACFEVKHGGDYPFVLPAKHNKKHMQKI
ncbi:hypothetical protein TRFO_15505 [Tritrichomonas foetus]|uniref:diacylglycerol kinase (ATP) n=1 Tax=Tritrichomonas foetus TaxID=1144522 RepID=A0A1J4KSX3_9EUKA|nr:hypothetical protein TRFO_15505 [Tritrichomonas foetus]|eukprot:OHT14210.1 hypothetical protein TRFO_15505 [Tritrichomonas foetus]